MKEIYLDREQCEKLHTEYYEKDSINLRADVILSSKTNGYDQAHTDFLQEYSSRNILLMRHRDDPPGWYRVLNTTGRV